MDITINIGGPIVDAINNLAAALQAGVKTEQAIETAKATSKAKKPASKTEEPEETTEVGIPATPTETGIPVSPLTDREAIQPLASAVAKKHTPSAVKAVIEKFGVKFAKDVTDEQVPALIAALQAKLDEVNNG